MLGCVKSVERKYFNPSGGLSQTLTLTKGQVVENCVPFVTYQSSASSTDAARWRVDVYFPNSTQIKIERTAASDNIAGYVNIVEFDPNKVRVQQGSFTCVDENVRPQNTAITLAQTVDTSKTAAVVHYRTSLTGISNWDTHSAQVSLSSTTLSVYRYEGDDTALYGHYYVFESLAGNFTTQQKQLNFGGGDTFQSDTITAVNGNKSFVISSVYTTNTTNWAYCTFDAKLVGGSSVEAERFSAGAYTTTRFFIIEFHDDTTVRHGDISLASGDLQDDYTIVDADLDFAAPINTTAMGTLKVNTSSSRLGLLDHYLTSSTNLRVIRNTTGVAAEGRYQVVEFAQAPGYYFGGTVNERAIPSDPLTPVVTTVRAYRRDTGEFVGEATSSGIGGSYYLETTYSGEHYVVALDPAGGESYNILGYDLVVPTTISGG